MFQVKDPLQAEIVKVVPTPNNGFSEIVKLHHTKVIFHQFIYCVTFNNIGDYLLSYNHFQSTRTDDSRPDVWFMFQKSKYVYDWDDGQFHAVVFPVDKLYDEYLKAKGYDGEEAMEVAEKKYGKNEMIMVCIHITYINKCRWKIVFHTVQNTRTQLHMAYPIFRWFLSLWSFSKRGLLHHSLCSKYSVLLFGALTSIGTTPFSP